MTDTLARPARNEHMTFKANIGVARHGWLRLTPAYGVQLVRNRLSQLEPGSVVTDPFSGTGTTPLAAAEYGHFGQAVDVNPFLVWLGQAKTRQYDSENLPEALIDLGHDITARAGTHPARDRLWQPAIYRIQKWWSPGTLHALRTLRASIDRETGDLRDLLEIALCRTLISTSSAAFNHQSMSFKDTAPRRRFDHTDTADALSSFTASVAELAHSAAVDLPGSASIYQGDSRKGLATLEPADLVLTSPPYCNRMSYIRELRPYMYWLRYLEMPNDAGELDWRAIGGTWGTATSKLSTWAADFPTPVDAELLPTCDRIAESNDKSGKILAAYVHKYHYDMWQHFEAITPLVKHGGSVSYIVGNSTFYGHEVPVHRWYAAMLAALGFKDIHIDLIRKRNSNKALFEYDVRARRSV